MVLTSKQSDGGSVGMPAIAHQARWAVRLISLLSVKIPKKVGSVAMTGVRHRRKGDRLLADRAMNRQLDFFIAEPSRQ
jgi:hypothetical protein